MDIPDITFTLQDFHLFDPSLVLNPSDFAKVAFTDGHRTELMWVLVVERLKNGTLRARLASHPVLFTELALGEFVYFQVRHVQQVRAAQCCAALVA